MATPQKGAAPSAAPDTATKGYVDTQLAGVIPVGYVAVGGAAPTTPGFWFQATS